MMWFNYLFVLIVIEAAAGMPPTIWPWPVEVGKKLTVKCMIDSIKNLPGIDPLEVVHRVTLKVGDGKTYATFFDPKPNTTDSKIPYIQKFEENPKSIHEVFCLTGGEPGRNYDYKYNAETIYLEMNVEKAECYHVTDYTCIFEYFTNYSEKLSAIKSFSRKTKKFKVKTNISPKPVILGHPMTVTCSDSANNDDLNVKVVHISMFIKHEGSFKRLVSYKPDESVTLSSENYGPFQLPGVTKNSFKASVNRTNGKPRYSMMMKVDSALMEHVAVYKCQYEVVMPNGCTKTEEFIVDENVRAECEDFRFGSKCSMICKCKNASEICNKVTGHCLSGCQPEWKGDDCQTTDCSDKCGKHTCEVKEGVVTCLCLPGYVNSGSLHCKDIDECTQLQDICHSHRCVNTNGSYMCECRHGYRNIGGQMCIGEDLFLRPECSSFKLDDIDARTIFLGLFFAIWFPLYH